MIITEQMLDDRIGFVGTTGSGKTYTAKGLVERLLAAQMRVCVVDPLGVWWGLRFSADRQAPGFDVVVFGGRYCDVPITDQMGARVAEIVATKAISCVIDLSELGTSAARRRFMTAFSETIYERNQQPLHLVLDECDLWAPQRPMPDQTVLLNRIDEIVRRGRVRGFIPWLISQRPAVIHKDVLSQIGIMVTMALTSSQDRAAIGLWIEGAADRDVGKAILNDLPTLENGHGYVWAPKYRVLEKVKFPAITTFDSSRTPQRGERVEDITSLPPIDISGISALLDEAPAKPAADAGKRPAKDALETASREGYAAGQAEAAARLLAAQERERELLAVIRGALGYLAPHAAVVDGMPVIDVQRPAAPHTIEHLAAAPRRRADPAPPASPPPATIPPAGDGKIVSAARSLFLALVEHHPARLTWTQVATLAGRVASGGQFNTGRKNLRELGYIEEAGNLVGLTAAAVEYVALTRPEALSQAPSTRDGLIEMWASKLPSPAPNMLRFLATTGPGFISPVDLAALMDRNPAGGQWNTGVATLRANGLIELAGKAMRLSSIFHTS